MATRLTSEDLVLYRAAAQKAQATCDEVLSSTERWQNIAKQKSHSSDTLREIQEKAFRSFSDLLDAKVNSEKARFQIKERLSRTHKKDSPQWIADLEHQKTVLDNACDSMMADFVPAKAALESLLGGNQDDALTAAWNSLRGKTPHFNSFSTQRRARSASAGTESEMRPSSSNLYRNGLKNREN